MTELHVVASTIDRIHIEYHCPACKNTHRHGSMGSTRNRVESRGSHCTKSEHPSDVEIHITDATARPRSDGKPS